MVNTAAANLYCTRPSGPNVVQPIDSYSGFWGDEGGSWYPQGNVQGLSSPRNHRVRTNCGERRVTFVKAEKIFISPWFGDYDGWRYFPEERWELDLRDVDSVDDDGFGQPCVDPCYSPQTWTMQYPPEWDGADPMRTWGRYIRSLDLWQKITDIHPLLHGFLMWQSLKGEARELVGHFSMPDLHQTCASIRIRRILVDHYCHHVGQHEDYYESDTVNLGRYRCDDESLLDFVTQIRQAFEEALWGGYVLSNQQKGEIFLDLCRISRQLEIHLESLTGGSIVFTELEGAIHYIAQCPSTYPGDLDLVDDNRSPRRTGWPGSSGQSQDGQ